MLKTINLLLECSPPVVTAKCNSYKKKLLQTNTKNRPDTARFTVCYTDFSVAQAQSRGDNSSDGRASGKSVRFRSCRLGFDSSRVKLMISKLVFTASPLDAQH